MAGFPLLLSVLRGARRPDWAEGVLLATLVLVRAPLLLVIFGLRPAIMRAFLDETGSLGRAVARRWLVLGGRGSGDVSGRGGRATVVRAVFGASYSTQASDLAALTGGSVLIALIVVSGRAPVAADRHTASTAGWPASLLLPRTLPLAVPSVRWALLTAVLPAPVAGLVVHALARRSARPGRCRTGHRRDGGRPG